MYRSFCMLFYVLYLYGGERLAVGQATTGSVATETNSFTDPTRPSSVESTTMGPAAVTSTPQGGPTTVTVQPRLAGFTPQTTTPPVAASTTRVHTGLTATTTASFTPQTTTPPVAASTTTVQPSLTANTTASFAPQATTGPAESVCTIDTKQNATCNVSRGSQVSGCSDQETWIAEVSITRTDINNSSVLFDGIGQPVLFNTVKTNRTVIFQYSISCCYASSTFMVGQRLFNSTTCRVHVSSLDTTMELTFANDTLAHVAIACGGGICLIVLVLCLVACVRSRNMEQKPGKFKSEELGDTMIERLQPQRCGAPRRTTLDSVFEVSHTSSDPQTPAERSRGYVFGLDSENNREGSYPADERYKIESYERPRPSPDRRHHDVSSYHPMSTFQSHEDERLRQFSRFAEQPNEHYDRPYDARDFSGVNLHGNEWERPPYHRGIRRGPPADFDMY